MTNIEHINYIKTPAAKVYEALTTEKGLSEVWTRELKVKPEINFINEFDFDDGYATKMQIKHLTKNRRIEWACVESDPEWIGTSVIFDLTEKNGVTTVILNHANWKDVTEFYRWCNYNWGMFLLSLKEYCEDGKGTPFQERKF
ncbi:SRPBCC family protein [Sinomicrobium weinanense]|uniref:SRPBCC domain-containing protein n=1 Tax=Sinomicrobium weinanense TaxID=2842200 RepID=A0A926JRH9_9FLAO|nr:SRPBCC domain-containing protein [Sinomicrobium weinanense]MBC9796108.1 SRPBCC domain-containing protein [Sinomicrobium weinanense]MBU3124777.1 SRPBCC domain-containing protein [Sinomicrobium weinanense]